LSLALLLLLNISLGSVSIPIKDVFNNLTGGNSSKETWDYIIINYRLPKAIAAILVGMGLSISGLLMQTLFRNPLAGPDVLGLSSGASLGVAIIVLGASFLPIGLSSILLSSYGIILASSLGSFLVLLAVLTVSQRLRDTMAILIVGLMFASLTSAIVGTLTYFSTVRLRCNWFAFKPCQYQTFECFAFGRKLCPKFGNELQKNAIDYHLCHQYFGGKYHCLYRPNCFYWIGRATYCQVGFSNE
jgi:ABC-type Fe3+-siderophore transport system permease subunit